MRNAAMLKCGYAEMLQVVGFYCYAEMLQAFMHVRSKRMQQ
jgi:hypothetical protein